MHEKFSILAIKFENPLAHVFYASTNKKTDYIGKIARITNGNVTYLHKDHLGSAFTVARTTANDVGNAAGKVGAVVAGGAGAATTTSDDLCSNDDTAC